MTPIKLRNQVPPELQSCHTAMVDGYVIEGHVPVREINRLLNKRPDIIRLAVPGMPIGSPGMEGSPAQPYAVYSFDGQGNQDIHAATYPYLNPG